MVQIGDVVKAVRGGVAFQVVAVQPDMFGGMVGYQCKPLSHADDPRPPHRRTVTPVWLREDDIKELG